jgi:S1-C subfamily serine protease
MTAMILSIPDLRCLLSPLRVVMAGCWLITSSSLWAQLPDTADVYADWRDRVVQVQVIDRQSDSKAGIGSGFFAGQPGWIVTNYHVISNLVNEEGRYRAHYLAEQGDEGELELLAVDPVHDLALLKTDSLQRQPLALAAPAPPKGSRLWSMGYPFDIGLTIVEGTYNGRLEKSLYEKLHFTGSINPGMSGGPTLDQTGSVVGVNVSTAGNQVSFLVPVRHVATLLDGAGSQPASVTDLNSRVSGQLLNNQQHIVDGLLAGTLAETSLNGFTVPGGLANWLNCWGNSQEAENDGMALVYYRCQTTDDIFLSQSHSTGIIRYQHELLSTDELGPMRFYRQLQQRNQYPRMRLDGDEQSVTNYRCEQDFLEQSGMPMEVTYCVRRYRKLEGLYDAYLSLTSLTSDQEALQSTLVIAGFSWENLERFVARFLGTYGWTP